MDNPELYSKCTGMTQEAAVYCLEQYAGKMSWQHDGDTFIDLGCGDGSVTQTIKTYITPNYTKFVASDISEEMVKYAASHNEDERTSFRVFNIEGDLPLELRGNFNHVFSFFTLQWMRDQEKGYRNIFDMMTEGGDCLLSFLGYTPIHNLFYNIGHTSKWSNSWLKDLGRYISSYYDMKDIEATITKMLEVIGFSDIEVKNNKITYMMDNGLELRNTIKAVEPYQMPPDVFEDFMRDCLIAGQDIGLLEPTANSIEKYNKQIEYKYNLIVIYAKKPRKEN